MAVPKRKTSKSKKRMRQGTRGADLPHASVCPHCHNPREPHRVCPHCGYYKGKIVAQVEGA